MRNFWDKNKNFLAIIIGAIIIGGFIYSGSQKNNEKLNVLGAPKLSATISAQNSTQATKINSEAGIISCGAADNTVVTKVIDGDTVIVAGGWHVRLLGMDADENGYPCYLPAKNRLEDLILAKQVILEKDKTDVDQYGRCLRYIFFGDANINVQLVAEGLAVARFYVPDVKYKSEIASAEKQAQQNKTGCKWSGTAQTTVK